MNIYELALTEDLEPSGDLSTKLFEERNASAQIIAKEAGVFACSELIEEVFQAYKKISKTNPNIEISYHCKNGDQFQKDAVLVEIKAPSHALLICERTILNFLQRCCAVASKARELSEIIKDYKTEVLDTRKTSPGMRALEKQAFKQGGGTNHRFNLSDMAMLKENHLSLLDQGLIESVRKLKKENYKIEVEINKDNLAKLELVAKESVDQIMFDNFQAHELPNLIERVKNINPKIKLEASGGITKDNILDYAKTSIDYVSTAEASRARNIDLSMLIGA